MAKSGMPALDSTTLLIIVVIVVVIIFVVYFFNKERESFGNCPERFSERWDYFEGFANPNCLNLTCNKDNVGQKCNITFQGTTSTKTCSEFPGLKKGTKYYKIA